MTTATKQQQLREIGSVVRALVTSIKPPCPLRTILRDFSETECRPLPFRSLGYNSAEELLRDIGEFTFSNYGGDICIAAKYNANTAHIAKLVCGQKTSKSSHISKVKQVQRPRPRSQNWNSSSSYSTNSYQKQPPLANRFVVSQNRANNGWDRNNNNTTSAYKPQQKPQQPLQPQKLQQPLQPQKLQQPLQPQKLQQPLQPKKLQEPLQPKKLQEPLQVKKLQEPLQAKKLQEPLQPQKLQKPQQPAAVAPLKDLRDLLTSKVQQPKMDFRERLNAKQKEQQQHVQKQLSPRPILGQNNGYNNGVAHASIQQQQQQQQLSHQQQPPPLQQQHQLPSPQSQQQLLQNNAAIENASSLILAQREQKSQQEQQQKQRAELLAKQRKQQQEQQERATQQQQLQQQQSSRSFASNGGNGGAVSSSSASSSTFMGGNSVQNRLRVKIQNGSVGGGGNSAGNTPDLSPAISSAGSEQMQNPFGQMQQQRFVHSPPVQPPPQPPQPQQQEPTPVMPPKVFQFNHKLDAITSLSQYCVVRRCTPQYSIIRSKFSRLYTCRVDVKGSIFSTYPNEYITENLAKINCAQQAIEQIRIQEARRPMPPCTDTDNQLTQKLFNELLSHPHGIFAKNVPEWFESAFEQSLPEHWWSLVQTSNKFITETVNKAVILFANTDAEKDESLSALAADPTSTNADTTTTTTTIQMDGIKLPWMDKHWNLHITHCMSTVEVWARLIGKEYSDRLDALMNDIDAHMLEHKTRPLSIACNNIYLVCIPECWHRVRVEELDKLNGTALCIFIDFGDADWLPVSKLHICEPQFLRLVAQAVPFSLFGLEDFAENPNAGRHLDALLASKSVVGEILTKEGGDASGRIQCVLYDTSSHSDVNVNHLLLNRICDDTPPPELKRTGVTNVRVTHVSASGDLYMQILNSELKYVQKLIHQLIESKFKRDQHKITRDDLKPANLFLICDDNAAWYRGELNSPVLNSDNDELIDIFCVDIGEARRIHISKIFRLESLSTALSKFPNQAIRVRLDNIPEVTPGIVGRMRALLLPNGEALVKVSRVGTVPLVTVYTRREGRDGLPDTLCTINDDLRIEHELEFESNLDDSNDAAAGVCQSLASPAILADMTRGLTITSVPNSPAKLSELPKLKNYDPIPIDGNFLEVRVTMSANPSNFMIQPYTDYPYLRTLMKELQEYCENNDEFIPADMVEIGQAYAAKNADGFYHRVTVVDIYSEMIHVCFCDFGDITVIRSDELKILPAKFRQLAKMAIQAKLYGIVAKNEDWTREDCLRFRELTVAQKFVAVVKRTSSDKFAKPATQVLELELIDVKTDEDIYIHELLLKENRAVAETPATRNGN